MNKVDYDNISTNFSKSRIGMKWEEIDYFINNYYKYINGKKILDIGCGNGRLGDIFLNSENISNIEYFGVDSSSLMIQEAKKISKTNNFFVLDMTKIDSFLDIKFDNVFFIASFHHLETIQDRLLVLEKLKKIINPGSYIYMTNWALESKINNDKYKNSFILNSTNEFGSNDYNIKFGDYNRYYHCFCLDELEFLFKKSGYKIIENRLFKNNKNFISILQY